MNIVKNSNKISTLVNLQNNTDDISRYGCNILGSILFNVFINDIFLLIKHGQLYNYADGNTLLMSYPDFNVLIESLVDDSKSLIQWFDFSCMQANPGKFQV